MRAATALRLLAVLFLITITPAFAGLPTDQGLILHGSYWASGRVSVAGITVRYLQSRASVNSNGRIRGNIKRLVTDSSGRVLESDTVRLTGNCSNFSVRGRSFTAKAILRLSGGVLITGQFNGLTDPSQRLSRYFHGKISGVPHSTFVLRSR